MELTLVEKHQIKYHSKEHKECDKLCFLSKNLYNSTLYAIRQHYFNTKKYLNHWEVNKQFAFNNQPDYRSLPAKVAQWTQKLVDQNFKSFFALLKTENLSFLNIFIKQNEDKWCFIIIRLSLSNKKALLNYLELLLS